MPADLKALFAVAEDEFLHFERIQSPRHPRPDLCAFLVLHDLVPSADDMISDARHDEYFLSVDVDELADVATQEIVTDLVRCGVRLSDDSLCLFT